MRLTPRGPPPPTCKSNKTGYKLVARQTHADWSPDESVDSIINGMLMASLAFRRRSKKLEAKMKSRRVKTLPAESHKPRSCTEDKSLPGGRDGRGSPAPQ